MSDDGTPSADEAPDLLESTGLRRITGPVTIAILVIAVVGVVTSLRGGSVALVGGAIAALLAGAAGMSFIFFRRSGTAGPDTAAFVAVGLAGALLAGLLPNTPGFVLVYWALAGLGMRLPAQLALAAGLVVFAALDLASLLAARISVPVLASQDVGAAFVFAVGVFTRSARISQDQARIAQERAEDLLAQLRASQAAQAEAAALTERARLAREIHDVLAHALSGLVLTLDTMELLGRQADADPGTLPRMLEQVTRGQRIARDGLANTKRAIAALRGDELPGPELLDRLVRDTTASTRIRAELTVTGPRRPLPPEMGLALYRTTQEALTNTVKYAGHEADVQLRLTYLDDAVELVIEDCRSADAPNRSDGLTFGGYGLTGMRERAELLGGSLTAGPTDRGFGVQLRLPADPAAGPASLTDPVPTPSPPSPTPSPPSPTPSLPSPTNGRTS